jgi:hypothetical protein
MMEPRKDLLILVADSCMENAVAGLLARRRALQIRSIDYDIDVHPHRDPGCLNKADVFLRPFSESYDHAIVMLDHDGCGREEDSPEEIENDVTEQLRGTGWGDRARTLVLAPELEVWVWSDSPEVDRCLGWSGRLPDLRQWLAQKGLWREDREKPADPKPAMKAALREAGKAFSASIFRELARKVSVNRCTDRTFLRFKNILQEWFGQQWT